MSDIEIDNEVLENLRNMTVHSKYDSQGRLLCQITQYSVPLNGISVEIQNIDQNFKRIDLTDIQVEFLMEILGL